MPIQIVFHKLDPSPAIEANIRERAGKLEQYYDQIVGCRVVVEAPHKHHTKGNLYSVRITVTVPGEELVVSRAPGEQTSREDAYVAVREAFDTMRRRLQDYARKRRGD